MEYITAIIGVLVYVLKDDICMLFKCRKPLKDNKKHSNYIKFITRDR